RAEKSATKRALEERAKELGFESVEAMEAALKAAKEAQDARKTEAEKPRRRRRMRGRPRPKSSARPLRPRKLGPPRLRRGQNSPLSKLHSRPKPLPPTS